VAAAEALFVERFLVSLDLPHAVVLGTSQSGGFFLDQPQKRWDIAAEIL
jgi:hypothetical protein